MPILNALERIYHDRSMRVEVDCPDDILFRGEKQDLEEMLGNLLDNAFKYGETAIRVRCSRQEGEFVLVVEDDGPGLSRRWGAPGWADCAHSLPSPLHAKREIGSKSGGGVFLASFDRRTF